MDVTKVQTSTGIDSNGNRFTQSVRNDQLDNEDFLKIMIRQLKLQDPTSPMDSSQMMDTQMKMSSMSTNLKMVEMLSSLSNSFNQNALSSSTQFIDKIVETNEGREFLVSSIEKEGENILFKGKEILVLDNNGEMILSEELKSENINNITKIS